MPTIFMNAQRIEMLKKLALEEPQDPFYMYALALESLKDDKNKASSIFVELIDKHPEYLPSYYQAGLLLIESGDHIKATAIIDAGITLSKTQKNSKTQSELQSLLDQL